jgi:hypothetical protein
MSNKNHSSNSVHQINGNPNNGNLLNFNLSGLKFPMFQHQVSNTTNSNSNENSIEEPIKIVTQQPSHSSHHNKKHHIQPITPAPVTSQNLPIHQIQPIQPIQPIQQVPENLFHLMELLTNLKLLSHLKQHDKLTCDTKNDLIEIDSRYYLQGIRRWICGDTRAETINFIDKLVVSAEYLSENLILSKNVDDKHNLKILTEDLISSKNGLNNLKITYFDDKLFVSRVENYLEKIKLRIDKNNKAV